MSKIIGLDYGEKRIGVAISSEDMQYSFPYETIDNSSEQAVQNWLRTIIQDEEVVKLVIGMPLNQHGEKGAAGEMVEKFGQMLGQTLGIKIVFEDERFSSVEATRLMQDSGLTAKKSRKFIDQQSAQLILQTYLERQHG